MTIPVLKKYIKREELYVERRLPSSGKIFVKKGEQVKSFDKIGESSLVKDTQKLEYKGKPVVKVGHRVYPGDVLATNKTLVFKKTEYKSTISGRVKEINEKNGVIYIEGVSTQFSLISGVSGEVVDTLDNKSVLIKTNGVVVKGVAGSGDEIAGELYFINDGVINDKDITEAVRGKIIVGNNIDLSAVSKAKTMGALGFVIGSCEYTEYKKFLQEDLPVLVLEGFGSIDICKPLIKYFNKIKSKFCVVRTYENLLILPSEELKNVCGVEAEINNNFLSSVSAGNMVQVFSKDYYGKCGIVKATGGEKITVTIEGSDVELSYSSVGLLIP